MKEDTKKIKVVKHDKPKFKLPKINVDVKLHPKLDKVELTSCLNQSFCLMGIGVPGSGKTSLIASWLESKQLFNKVFDKIYLFMPENSFRTMKHSILQHIPDDQVFFSLNVKNLEYVKEEIEENAKEKHTSFIIFDDVQQYLKDHKIMKRIGELAANRRHLRTCIYFAVQYYKKVPKDVRSIASHLACFNLSEEELKLINKETIGETEDTWEQIVRMYKYLLKTAARQGEKAFLFCDLNRKRFFVNWDEIVVPDAMEDHNLISKNNSNEDDKDRSISRRSKSGEKAKESVSKR
jgi:hypothetical protein